MPKDILNIIESHDEQNIYVRPPTFAVPSYPPTPPQTFPQRGKLQLWTYHCFEPEGSPTYDDMALNTDLVGVGFSRDIYPKACHCFEPEGPPTNDGMALNTDLVGVGFSRDIN